MPRNLARPQRTWQTAHRRGRWAEFAARFYLLCKGYRAVARPTGRPLAQTDLLLTRGRTIVLVEVKHRRSALAASYALSPAQARRLRAEALRVAKRHPGKTVRIDALWVMLAWPFFRHIPNAVPPAGA